MHDILVWFKMCWINYTTHKQDLLGCAGINLIQHIIKPLSKVGNSAFFPSILITEFAF